MALVCKSSLSLLRATDLRVESATKLVCMAIDAMIAGGAEEVGLEPFVTYTASTNVLADSARDRNHEYSGHEALRAPWVPA